MSNVYKVYLTANNGDDVPQELADWFENDGPLVLRLSAFAKDAVITIEPRIMEPDL